MFRSTSRSKSCCILWQTNKLLRFTDKISFRKIKRNKIQMCVLLINYDFIMCFFLVHIDFQCFVFSMQLMFKNTKTHTYYTTYIIEMQIVNILYKNEAIQGDATGLLGKKKFIIIYLQNFLFFLVSI